MGCSTYPVIATFCGLLKGSIVRSWGQALQTRPSHCGRALARTLPSSSQVLEKRPLHNCGKLYCYAGVGVIIAILGMPLVKLPFHGRGSI